MKSNFVKGITLTIFLGLITTFVLYKSGVFDGDPEPTISGPSRDGIEESPNDTNKKDSSVTNAVDDYYRQSLNGDSTGNPDSIIKVRFDAASSSKSIIIYDEVPEIEVPADSSTIRILPSSKSGRVFEPDFNKKKKKDTNDLLILPSSKSASPIITPEQIKK